eukprot:Amastigsp_a175315_89.p3 type:complete len:151 gc:universal Amastigsp_a175315_89:893-441(-)
MVCNVGSRKRERQRSIPLAHPANPPSRVREHPARDRHRHCFTHRGSDHCTAEPNRRAHEEEVLRVKVATCAALRGRLGQGPTEPTSTTASGSSIRGSGWDRNQIRGRRPRRSYCPGSHLRGARRVCTMDEELLSERNLPNDLGETDRLVG